MSFVLPAPCLSCEAATNGGHLGLCGACRLLLRTPPPGCARCHRELSASTPEGYLCGRCRSDPPAFDRLIAAWVYRPPLMAVIAGLKYHRLEYLGRHLARDLDRRLTAECPFDWIVPVPLHWRRAWTRGFNQAERIAEALAALKHGPLRRCLVRSRATPSQTRLTRPERRRNVVDAFRVRRRALPELAGCQVLLVDDVATTGATLDAAARALKEAGVRRVTAAVAALTPEPGIRG